MRLSSPLPLLLLIAGLAFTDTAQSQQVVTCESVDGHTRFCPADTRGGAYVKTQLSRAACREGQTWGYDARGIWTANGCRATFALGTYSSPTSNTASNNAAAAVAAVAILAAGAAAVHREHEREQRQRDDYHEYSGYGYDGYPAYREPPPTYPPRYPDAYRSAYVPVRCESIDGRTQVCPADVRRGRAEVTRQLSRSACRFGENWGYDARAIWVSRGCRAEFVVIR